MTPSFPMVRRPIGGRDCCHPVSELPSVAPQTPFQRFHHHLASEVRVRGGATGNERIVNDHRGFPANVAMVATTRTGSVPQDVFQGIWRWSHIKIQELIARHHKAGAIQVVILFAVAGDMFAPDDALPIIEIASKGEARDAVTLD